MNIINLHHAVAAVCPIVSVYQDAAGVAHFNPTPEATAVQQAAAQAVIDGWDAAADARAGALAATKFTPLQVLRAMRDLGLESALDTLLASNSSIKKEWEVTQEVDLNDATTVQALTLLSVDIDAVKLQIAGVAV